MGSVALPSATQVAMRFGQFNQALYLSMLGTDVWRMYRQGIAPALLVDLHAVPDDINTFSTHMPLTVKLALASGTYRDLAHLGGCIERHAALMRRNRRNRWIYQKPLVIPDMANVLGSTRENPHVVSIVKLATVMFENVYRAERGPQHYRMHMQTMWFDLCDAALVTAGDTP